MLMGWMELPWLERFLPNRLRTVNDEILADQKSIDLLQETERILDKLIEQGNKYNNKRTIKKRHLEYKIFIKITRKKISLAFQDTHLSKATYKKKFYIQCFRKYYKAENGVGKCLEASIHYLDNGKTYVRSIRKSPFLQAIFFKIDRLDDALIGQLIDQNYTQQERYPVIGNDKAERNQETKLLLMESKRLLQHHAKLGLDPLLEHRLEQIMNRTEKLMPHFLLLDIEERYIVKRMLREEIPTLIHTYLSLSIENQLTQKENVFVALSKMELKLIQLEEDMEKARMDKIDHLLKLNELRYSKEKNN